MKTKINLILAAIFIFSASALFAQNTLTKSVQLSYTMGGGTNGCAVAYNPKNKMYYACIAGNKEYPLEIFTEDGVSKYKESVGFDSRGLWYNPKTKRMEGSDNANSIFAIKLDSKGFPLGVIVVSDDITKPYEQSVGAYDAKKKQYIFYDKGALTLVDSKKNTKAKEIWLDVYNKEDLNYTSVIFTGIKDKEYGMLDYISGEVLLFNRKGELTAKYKLPSDAVVNNAFRFSYANNLVFLYDVETRTWTGYAGIK